MGEENLKVNLLRFEAVSKYKSVSRAFRRGHISYTGILYSRRPFNNRKNKPLEDTKRRIYEGFKRHNS